VITVGFTLGGSRARVGARAWTGTWAWARAGTRAWTTGRWAGAWTWAAGRTGARTWTGTWARASGHYFVDIWSSYLFLHWN
jgi:hypothetical protein